MNNNKMSNDDILQLIPYEQLPKLQELFKYKGPYVAHVYNFIGIWMRHKLERPSEHYVSFYCPNGDFNDGTFIATIEIHYYDIFIFTWDRSLTRLKKSLLETNRIDWKRNPIFCALNSDYFEMLNEVAEIKEQKIVRNIPCHIWWLPKEKALQFHYEIPEDLYLGRLNATHIIQIYSEWPDRAPNNKNYLLKLLEMNYGIGLFLKHTHNNELVASTMKNEFNGVGIFQTAAKHKRKGYGSLLAKIAAKMIAEEEQCDITGFIIHENSESQNLCANIGFKPITSIDWCYFNVCEINQNKNKL